MVNKQSAELTMAKFICIFMQLYPVLNFIAILKFGYLEIKKKGRKFGFKQVANFVLNKLIKVLFVIS